tara:strand:- start:1410 stop:2213 length:804 start_codon:yes stop_codon:yes gene_type:complete
MYENEFLSSKINQKEMWAGFAPSALFTTPVAAKLLRFSGFLKNEKILDIGTGTGVVAITASRMGANVCAIDLTPELLLQAKEDAKIANQKNINWIEGDAEFLPFEDNCFNLVISQFGHMFAPRPKKVVDEIFRVLCPGGKVVFATWPPEHLMGKLFRYIQNNLRNKHFFFKPELWGNPSVIERRLKKKFEIPIFLRGVMITPALSVSHRRLAFEKSFGPLKNLLNSVIEQPEKILKIQKDLDKLISSYFSENLIHQDYIFTKAKVKK